MHAIYLPLAGTISCLDCIPSASLELYLARLGRLRCVDHCMISNLMCNDLPPSSPSMLMKSSCRCSSYCAHIQSLLVTSRERVSRKMQACTSTACTFKKHLNLSSTACFTGDYYCFCLADRVTDLAALYPSSPMWHLLFAPH